MKKVPRKLMLLLIMVVCVAMVSPLTVWAGEKTRVLVDGMEYGKGDFSFPESYLKSFNGLQVSDKTNKLEFVVVNGDTSGRNRVSSARITMLDSEGNLKVDVITPNQFNQNEAMARNTLFKDDLAGLSEFSLDLKVRGPKNGYITVYVTEYYEEDVPCPWWDRTCK